MLLSPLDDRYRDDTKELTRYFSQPALIRNRVLLEVRYLKQLFPKLGIDGDIQFLDKLKIDFKQVKEYEKQTRHDVKAIEYFLRDKFCETNQSHLINWIHFGLTSEDVDSTAYTMCYKNSIELCIEPAIKRVTKQLRKMASRYKEVLILGRTHGQPATPTPFAKELLCFNERIRTISRFMDSIKYTAKFGGATGNFNAHYVVYPDIDWIAFAEQLLAKFELRRSRYTKQTDHRDSLALKLECLSRISNVCIELCRDIWMYMSYGYFTLNTEPGQIGSSTMPHKVNPIDFENAEGNFQMASNLLQFIGNTVTMTRMQRDISNSTVLRNGGVALGHMLLGLKRLQRGLGKLNLQPKAIEADMDRHPEVILEACQTILRKHGVTDAYERCMRYDDYETLTDFIDNMENIPEQARMELKRCDSVHNYSGRHFTEIS